MFEEILQTYATMNNLIVLSLTFSWPYLWSNIDFVIYQESNTQIAENDSNKLDHDSTQDKSEEKVDGETENQVRSFSIIKSPTTIIFRFTHRSSETKTIIR